LGRAALHCFAKKFAEGVAEGLDPASPRGWWVRAAYGAPASIVPMSNIGNDDRKNR
jgi:hypothetical protein